MRNTLRSVSGAALVLGLAGLQSAFAQQSTDAQTVAPSGPQQSQTTQTPSTVDQTAPAAAPASSDRVVVTGSFLRTAPEDAPKPVEVFTAQDLKESGSPSITEFVRSLNSAAPSGANVAATSTGAGVLGNGFVPIDLRGQGANGTLVLMNGRRLSTTNGGAGADTNTVPVGALEAVEVLKDGASSIYGAGAVGGVVNFRTRRDIDAPEISLSKTLYDGNDGSYKAEFLTGWVGNNGNIMVTASHEWEDSLMATERDFSTLPYAINPAGWSLTNSPSRFHRQTNWTTATAPTNLGSGATAVPNVQLAGGGTVGGSSNDFTSDADCATIGGALVQDLQGGQPGGTVPTGCAFPLANITELVSEYSQDQIYVEANYDLSDTMEVSFNVLYSDYTSTGKRPPSSGGNSARVIDPSITFSRIGTVNTSGACLSSCFYLIPYQQAIYTPGGDLTSAFIVNPFIADYNAREAGTALDVGPGGALLTSSQYRPYMFGGNPLFEDGLARSSVQRERIQMNFGVKGEFAGESILGKLLNGVTYDYAAQYNQYTQNNISNGDWLVNRLQDAMMGYGGPDCNAVDRVATDYSSAAAYNRTIGIQSDTAPGTEGCMWFNPFQSNFQSSIFNGATNPNFPTAGSPTWGVDATQAGNTGPTGYLNDIGLLDWIWADRQSEVIYGSSTFDAVFTGEVPESMFTLPGGNINWAAGGQWRLTDRRSVVRADDDEELGLLLQDCPYSHTGQGPQPSIPSTERPTSRGCAGTGTGNFFSGASPLEPVPGERAPGYTESETIAAFTEWQFPVLDNLNLSASIRHESFNNNSINGTIWGVAGKWDVTDNVYVRASYGTNFRAEAALDANPGAQIFDIITDTGGTNRFGTTYQYLRITETADNIGTEEDTTFNFGVGYQGEMFGGRLRASADFFRIDRREEVVTTLATSVLSNVFYTTATAPDGGQNPETDTSRIGTPNLRADCSARLVEFVQFEGGVCTQGTTTGADIISVTAAQLNGPGFLTEGIDYSISYTHPLFGGDMGVQFNLTQNLTYEADAFSVNGVVFDTGGDRLGYRNTLQTGSASAEKRANASISWGNDTHYINVRANYQDGLNADPGQTYTPIINYTAASGTPDVFSTYGWGQKDYIDYDLNYIYTAPFWQDLELRMSILNVSDRNPPPEQSSNGVVNQAGNVRGRRIEFGVTKKF